MINNVILENFREQILNQKSCLQTEWHQALEYLYEHGFGLEQTLKYLHFNRPSLIDFLHWFNENKIDKTIDNHTNSNLENCKVLSDIDIDFWQKNGYIVIKNAIPFEDVIATQSMIYDFLGAKINEPATWYKTHEAKEGLMVLFTRHPLLEKNRNATKIRKAYEQLYGTSEIYKTIDKLSFNPPETNSYKFLGSALHWDTSLQLPIPFQLQGLLYLTDVEANSGAFSCVEGFHLKVDHWIKNLPEGSNPREIALNELVPKPILGKAGDFIIWHQALPHCATPNKSNSPRLVQYFTYLLKENSQNTEIWI